MTSVNVAQSNFAPALRAFGDETVNQPLFFPLIAVLAVSDGFAPQHVRIVRFRTEAPPINWTCVRNEGWLTAQPEILRGKNPTMGFFRRSARRNEWRFHC